MAIDLGKIGITPKGNYNSSLPYEKLDLVTYQGSSYISLINNNSSPLTTIGAWQVSAIKGDTGSQGIPGIPGIPGPDGPKGNPGNDGIDGTNAQSFNYKGNVPNYSGLPSTDNVQNDAYYNTSDQKWYIYNGSSYPPDGQGILISLSLVSEFKLIPYDISIDLSKDNYSAYKEILGSITFTESLNSEFGKMAFYKLTGGNISFASNFKVQDGSDTYNPALTNVIVFWKEYNLVRYRIENLPYEEFPLDPNLITNYSFIGTPGTLVSNIPHTGLSAVGAITTNGIVANGQGVTVLSDVGSLNNAFGFNLTGESDYKLTLSGVTINGFLDIIVNGNTFNDGIRDMFTFDRTKYAHTHNNVTSSFSNFSTPINSEIIFEVNSGFATCIINGATVFTNRGLVNSNGGFVSIILLDGNTSVVQGLKIERT